MSSRETREDRERADRRGVLTAVATYRLMTRRLLLRAKAAPTEERIRHALEYLLRNRVIKQTDAERRGGSAPTRLESVIWMTARGAKVAVDELGIADALGSRRKFGTESEVDHRIGIVEVHMALRGWAGARLEWFVSDFEPGSIGREKATIIELGGAKYLPDGLAALRFPGFPPQMAVLEFERGGSRGDLWKFAGKKLRAIRAAAETQLVERHFGINDPVRFMMVLPTPELRDKALSRWPDPAAEVWEQFYVKALDDVTGPDFNGGWVQPGRDGFTELF